MFITDFIQWSPLVSIIVFSAVITFLLTWAYKKLINYPRYKEVNDRQKDLRKEMKGLKDPEKLAKIQTEMMDLSMESLKMTFKPMMITFIPLLIVYALLGKAYTGAEIGNIIAWGANLPIVGTGGGWLFCYILFSLIFNIIFRKLLKF
jgi:uncharacterized membrane protein (DUF106 family)